MIHPLHIEVSNDGKDGDRSWRASIDFGNFDKNYSGTLLITALGSSKEDAIESLQQCFKNIVDVLTNES